MEKKKRVYTNSDMEVTSEFIPPAHIYMLLELVSLILEILEMIKSPMDHICVNFVVLFILGSDKQDLDKSTLVPG
jgi:hypothetical protein